MSRTRRRLRNENAKLKAEIARMEAELRKSRMPHFRDIPYFGQDPSRMVAGFSSMFIHSRYQIAADLVNMTPIPDEEFQEAKARLEEVMDRSLRTELMRGTVTAETTPAQKGESNG